MCHSITCGNIVKKLKENAIKISPYCLHPLTLCSAKVTSREILLPTLQKVLTHEKNANALDLEFYRSVSLKDCSCNEKQK